MAEFPKGVMVIEEFLEAADQLLQTFLTKKLLQNLEEGKGRNFKANLPVGTPK